MLEVQMTTHETKSSPAHVRFSLEEMLVELERRGYKLLDVRRNRTNPEASEFILWHPESYTTVELYEEYPEVVPE